MSSQTYALILVLMGAAAVLTVTVVATWVLRRKPKNDDDSF